MLGAIRLCMRMVYVYIHIHTYISTYVDTFSQLLYVLCVRVHEGMLRISYLVRLRNHTGVGLSYFW